MRIMISGLALTAALMCGSAQAATCVKSGFVLGQGALMCGSAPAVTLTNMGTLTYRVIFPEKKAPHPAYWGDGTFLMGRFDTTLGTLVSATLKANLHASGYDEGQAFDGETAAAYPVASVYFQLLGLRAYYYSEGYDRCTAPIDDYCTVSASESAYLEVSGFIAPSDFGLVSGIGPGNISGYYEFYAWGGSAYGSATMTYTFEPDLAPVPLPSAGGLMVAVLGGLALMRRRQMG